MPPAAASERPRIPVHVLTGFLGSGKTTLLNRLLGERRLAGTAVIVNELGAIGIDHLLVERSDDRLVELAGGCLCCAVRGDLAVTLADLLARRDEGRCLDFERVVIETTGLADPVPVLNLLATDPGLADRARAGRVITTVDAVNGPGTLERHPEAVRQVALADWLVITKPELAPAGVDALARRLADVNPAARQVQAEHGRLEAAAADLIDGPDASPAAARVARHALPVHAHASGIDTFTVVREVPVPGAALALLIETLAAHLGPRLLRMKGLVALAEAPDTPAVVHGAQHVFHPLDFLPQWPDGDRRTRLVFIGEGLDGAWVEAVLEALIEEAVATSSRLRAGGARRNREEENDV